MLALLTLTAALLPGAPLGATRPVVLGEAAMSRRNALPIFGAGLAVVAGLPSLARADDDASIAAIAARANAKAAAEREAKMPKPVREEGEGSNLVIGALVASVALSVPFFYKNLQRLGIKIASGGKDDGRGSIR